MEEGAALHTVGIETEQRAEIADYDLRLLCGKEDERVAWLQVSLQDALVFEPFQPTNHLETQPLTNSEVPSEL